MKMTFGEAWARLGVETQRQWNDEGHGSDAPTLLTLYSLVTLMGTHLISTNAMPVRTAAWYCKAHATFSDTIGLVRRCLWSHGHYSPSGAESDVVKITRALLKRFTDALCYAA
jgi:hypothetical protein